MNEETNNDLLHQIAGVDDGVYKTNNQLLQEIAANTDGAGDTAKWGGISGNIDDQTDLKDELDHKADLDGNGKVPTSQLPPLTHDTAEAANQAAMLALDVTAPAMVIRTDFTPVHLFFLTADPATDISNWHDTGELGGGAGNPTATVGLTAKDGVLNTYLRSDGAPAIDQSIAPTWTGSHTFGAVSSASVPSASIKSSNPQLDFNFTNAGVDAKRWNWVGNATSFGLRTLNDAGTTGSNVWNMTRTGNAVTQQTFYISNIAKVALSATLLTSAVPTGIVTGTDGNKLWLAKYSSGTGHNNAPTAIGASSTYLQIGGREYGNNGFGGIGFSYVGDTTQHPAVWLGWEEKNTAGNTSGDFIIATRPTTTNVAPTERLRVTAAGDIVTLAGYSPATDQSLATKKTVTDAIGALTFPGVSNLGAPVVHPDAPIVSLSSSDPIVHLVGPEAADTLVQLPEHAPAGRIFTIKRMTSNAHGLNIESQGTIDGTNDIGMTSQYSFRTLISDGTNWHIIASNGA